MEKLEQEIKEELPQEDEPKEGRNKNQFNGKKSDNSPFIVFFFAISVLLLIITLVVLINRKRKK